VSVGDLAHSPVFPPPVLGLASRLAAQKSI
jgi:hypothetical protein